MKLFFKSAPLQLKQIDAAEAFAAADRQYQRTVQLLLHPGLSGGPGIHSLQRGPHTYSPFEEQLRDPVKAQDSFIPDIRQYLLNNGIADRARQDAFIDAGSGIVTPRMLIDKEAADVHEQMARSTRQSGLGRNNPGYEFGDSAEIASHDFGDLRFFKDPMTGLSVPLMHVRRAVWVNRHPDNSPSRSSVLTDLGLDSRITEAFRLGDHPSYGYLGLTHTHPALSSVTPSKGDLRYHDTMFPYGYSQIIRPGMNMDELKRRVIARYGSVQEAFRQWGPQETRDEFGWPRNNGPVKRNMYTNYVNYFKKPDFSDGGYGRDRTGMPIRGDSRVFLFRDSSRPLTWESGGSTDRPYSAKNYGEPRDFRSSHDGHVIYLGKPGSRKITDWSIIPHSTFMDAHEKFIKTGYYEQKHTK